MKEERKEDQLKEDQVKEDGTKDLSAGAFQEAAWARCPICNVTWDTKSVRASFYYFIYAPEDYGPLPAKVPERLCPDHAEEIVMDLDGRRKGIKRTLYKDQLSDMQKNGLTCPVCGGVDLERLIMWFDDLGPGLKQILWECKQCHAAILLELRFTTGDKDEIGKLLSVFYRENLQTKKELDQAWSTICGIIKSKERRWMKFYT
jgi:hypothetical protein